MASKKAISEPLIKILKTPKTPQKPISVKLLTESSFAGWLKKTTPFNKNWVKVQNFNAKKGEFIILPDGEGRTKEVIWGIGNNSIPEDPYFYSSLASKLPLGSYEFSNSLKPDLAFQASLGWCLNGYFFATYKSSDKNKYPTLKPPKNLNKKKLQAVLTAISATRDLINTPTNDLGPKELSAHASKLAKNHKAKIKVIIGDKLLKEGFPTIHAVGRASANPPRLIDMVWGKKTDPKVTLVGKGVCFDSGGLGIKPSGGMRWMKKDMGGAAHVLGLASAIMDLKLPIRLRVLIPAVENSISGNAFRPGDIIKSRKGINIEVGHTDAEGRLILCDALALADEEKPDILMDFATLTGAARVALGPELPALFTNDDLCAQNLVKLGEKIYDPLWRLPLWQPYGEDIKSSVADINNIGDGSAGAITAALFLEKFVEKANIWTHIDLFGWTNKAIPGRPKGGEAQTIRAVLEYLEKRYC